MKTKFRRRIQATFYKNKKSSFCRHIFPNPNSTFNMHSLFIFLNHAVSLKEELYKNSQIYYLKGKRVCFSFPV
jgi:hypothetical protein